MSYQEEDLAILKKETKLSELEAENLLKKCDGDVVTALLRFTGEDQKLDNKIEVKKLTVAQQKIQELRNIVDQKDEMLDKMLEEQKKTQTRSPQMDSSQVIE